MPLPAPKSRQFRALLCVTSIFVTIAVLYGHTLEVPWYLDDYRNLLENPLLRDPVAALQQILQPRGIVIASFALNYRLGGLDPAGYHLVNITIHAATTILVWLLLQRVVAGQRWWALGGALLFAAHPLQTQAVTYTVQRMTTLAACFFLLALYAYLRARDRRAAGQRFFTPGHLGWYGTALLAGACAALTKENTVVLPLVLWLWPRLFPDGAGQRLVPLLPFLVVPLWCAWLLVGAPLSSGAELHTLGHARLLAQPENMDRLPLRYLVSEFSVLWYYLRLFVFPIGQALDYNYPLTPTLLHPASLAAGAGLAGLLALAWILRARQALIVAGICWFFVTLAVESSIIPLDPLFEHRLYLPLFGLVLVVIGTLQLLPQRHALTLLFLLPLLCAPLTWQRNRLWLDPVAFYEDNLRQTPDNPAVAAELGRRYLERGDFPRAEAHLNQALQRNPRDSDARMSLAKLYIDQGRNGECIALLTPELLLTPVPKVVLVNLAVAYFNLGNLDRASHFLTTALSVDANFRDANALLGRILLRRERWGAAEEYLRRALWMDDRDPDLHFRLAIALYGQKRFADCKTTLLRALELRPNDPDTLLHLGLLANDRGERQEAESWLARLTPLDATKAAELHNELRKP